MATRAESKLQEELVALYLRLNGYFTSSFIVHSPLHGRSKTEIDALAVRFPFSSEPERQIRPDPNLQVSDAKIDLLLCEVKSNGQKLRFNNALVSSQVAIESVLRWAGMFPFQDVQVIGQRLREAMVAMSSDGPATIDIEPNMRVRAIVFSPELDRRRSNQAWCVDGSTIMQYMWNCLCPSAPRDTCATTYDLQAWGQHEAIVGYFKSRDVAGPGNIRALYQYFAANAP